MAYTANDLILAEHYNIFVSGSGLYGPTDTTVANINTEWGTGGGDHGYGQSTILAQVPQESLVTAAQWAALLARTTSMASHQGTALGSASSPTAGTLISALANVSNNVALVSTNRLTAAAVGTTSADVADDSSGWALTTTSTQTVEFASGDAARYFFNAGGYIDITFNRVGGGSTSKETGWDTLMSETGTIRLKAHGTSQVSGSGSGAKTVNTNYGYYEATTTAAEIFRIFPSGTVYGTNKINVTFLTNGLQGTNVDNGTQLTFITEMYDPGGTDDPITGDIQVTCTVQFPSTSHLTASWGTVTFPTSTVVQV